MAALLAMLCLARFGPATPLFRGLPIEWAILAPIAGFGLLAWHFARLTILPLAESASAALAATLILALTLPGLGILALILPVTLSIGIGWCHPAQRVVALMVQCGAIAGVVGAERGDFLSGFVYATMLGTALFLVLRGLSGAANDNPSMERSVSTTRLLEFAVYARSDSIPGKWGVS